MSPPFAPVEAVTRASGVWTHVGAVISVVAPFAVALGHAGSASVWRDDAIVLRGLGWVGAGYGGCVSALMAQASFFLPLGSVHYRLAVLGAVVLGAAGWAVHAWARDLLGRRVGPPLLADALAMIAALAATLSAAGQGEGALAGGSGVALLLAVMILRARPAEALSDPPRAIIVGMLGGALLAESALTAAVVGAGVAFGLLLERQKPAPRGAWCALASALASAALFFSPAWVRPFAASPFLEIGRAMRALPAASAAIRPAGALARLSAEGSIVLVLAALGFGIGLGQRRLRGAVAPLVVVAALYAASVFVEGRLLVAEEVRPLHLVATAAFAIGVAIAMQAIATALLGWRLPMAKGAAILLVMTNLTLAVAAAEQASFANDRSSWRGAEAFTDEALEQLPPATALLVRSRAAAWRLWAAQLAHGSRPDVLVIPVPGTGDTRLALRLLRTEPALQKALQDISLEGRPGEEALTILADARPVLVELDPAWDRRVLSHFVPDRLWLRFAPGPRGASDRKAAFSDLHARADRLLAVSSVEGKPDADSATMVRTRLADGAIVAASLGDREEAMALADRIGSVPGGELFAAELMQRLMATKSGAVEVKGLAR
jgi:hypothetical protein